MYLQLQAIPELNSGTIKISNCNPGCNFFSYVVLIQKSH